MTPLLPIRNNFAFTFVDRVNSKGQFEPEPSAGGIVLQGGIDDSAKNPRWVNVTAVGPECEVIKPGMQVLLPNLRWTSHFKIDDKMVWRSDEGQAAAYRNTPTAEVSPIGDFILFERIVKDFVRSTSLIVLVGKTDEDTPSGSVIGVGPTVKSKISSGDVLYFSDTNFTDTFKHLGADISFIKEDNILAMKASEE